MVALKLQRALDLIYPPRCLNCGVLVETPDGICGTCWKNTPFLHGDGCTACGAPMIGTVQDGDLCDSCLETPRPWARGSAAVLYEGNGRKLVLALKHGDRHDIVAPAARWMYRSCQNVLSPDMLVVPVPLHWRRLVKRRFNQSALLAQELARLADLDYCPDALRRVRHTIPTDGLSPKERSQMLHGAIRPHLRRDVLKGRHILLVDDVLTTGATLSACTEACLAAGAETVSIAVLALVTKAP